MPRRRGVGGLAALVFSAVLVVGCTGEPVAPTPEDPDIEVDPDLLLAGTCLQSDEPAPDIVEDHAVDCEDPHTHEILASVDIPRAYLSDWDATEEDYRSLSEAINGRAENDRAVQFEVWSKVVCEGAMQNRSGLAEVSVGGLEAIEARLVPFATDAIVEARFQPMEDWLERPEVMCVRELIEPVDGGLSAVPPPSQRDLRTVEDFITVEFLTAREDADGRVCADREGSWQTCTEPHYAERLYTFSAEAVLDEDEFDELSRLRLQEVPTNGFGEDEPNGEGEYINEFADMCEDTFDDIVGVWDSDVLRAEVSYGEGWVQERDVPRMICSVVPIEGEAFDLPAGSLIGAESDDVGLVPR